MHSFLSSYRIVSLLILILLGYCSSLSASHSLHPYHITIAEANYNTESGKLEVALRIYQPGSLEEALSRRVGERVRLERTENIDAMIKDYLKDALIMIDPEGERAKIEWVGKEVTTKTTWLYFEIPMASGPDGYRFTNKLLFEAEQDQVNTIVFGRGRNRRSLRFTRDDSTHTLEPVQPSF